MITNISIKKISPHPDNPRKDLGDLSELAESIKANGMLQNLTVVPWFSAITRVGCDDPKQQEENGYRVVIGHRRLAAAKLAGLTEVPCAISDMDHKQQVATMLTENMQRSDLTIYEQAQGLQMLLNFGESLDEIAKQTGFSETTIRRRVKLLELDQDKLKQAMARSATLQDYAELDKIQNLELRNSVLEAIGTGNFQWKLRDAIDQEKREQKKAVLIEKLNPFATQVSSDKGLSMVCYLSFNLTDPEKCLPADIGEKQYFYLVRNYDVCLLEKEAKGKKDSLADDQRRRIQERRDKLIEINNRAYQLRREFAKEFRPTKKQAVIIMEFAVRTMMETGSNYLRNQSLLELLEVEPPKGEITFDSFQEAYESSPERVLFITAYGNLDSVNDHFHDWSGNHKRNERLETVYDILKRLGYQISHEELQLIDGTHEMYSVDEGGNRYALQRHSSQAHIGGYRNHQAVTGRRLCRPYPGSARVHHSG